MTWHPVTRNWSATCKRRGTAGVRIGSYRIGARNIHLRLHRGDLQNQIQRLRTWHGKRDFPQGESIHRHAHVVFPRGNAREHESPIASAALCRLLIQHNPCPGITAIVASRMVPVTLTIRSGAKQKEFHYEVLNNSKLTPVAMMATFYNALQGVNEYGEETTYRLNGHIAVSGFPDVSLQNMFAPLDGGLPTAYSVALSLGDRFSRVFDNPTSTPDIKSVDLDVELVNDRRWLRLETARTDVTEARPGDDIILEAVLRPYRGERIVRQIPIKIPTSTPRGSLRILVSDGETLDRMRRVTTGLGRKMDLGTTIALLNKEHANHRLYVSMLEANPQATVEDKVMPTLPLSVMNVMDGMRGTQDMIVSGESAVNESSTPFDYVVTGSQVITVSVK